MADILCTSADIKNQRRVGAEPLVADRIAAPSAGDTSGGAKTALENKQCELYHILTFRVLPDFYRGDVDITGPCQVSIINIGTLEKGRIVQLLPIGLPKIRRAIKDTRTAAIEDNGNAMVIYEPNRL